MFGARFETLVVHSLRSSARNASSLLGSALLCLLQVAAVQALPIPDLPSLQQASVIFSVTGDVPYGSSEISVFQDQINDHNTYSPSSFIVHVGDILAGDESCNESRYITVADILKSSEVPAFIVPGDNETTDCSNPSQGWSYWEKHLSRIEENFCGTPPVERQSSQDENFAFVLDGMLFIGIHLVGGSNSSSILQRDADWVQQQFTDKVASVRGAVIFSQAGPGGNSLFFNAFETAAGDFGKPILFIHGDGHSWKYDHPFSEPNVLRVQIDRGDGPPVQVTATLDANNMFLFDRDPFSGAQPITRGPCGDPEPPSTWTLTTQVQGSGAITLSPTGGSYSDGTVVTLQAVADPGWSFVSWTGAVSGSSNPRTVTMDANKSVTAVFISNAPPVTFTDDYETDEDTPLTIATPGVLGNDTDPDNDPLTATLVQQPSHGAVQLASQGGFTYTPNDDWNGTDGFSYEADDGQGGTTQGNVTILVHPLPDPPLAMADTYAVGRNTMFQLDAPGVLQNDSDPDGDVLQAVLTSLPSLGVLQFSPDGALQYIPPADFTGSETFTYAASDGTSQSDPVIVTLQVDTPISGTVTLLPGADAFVLSTTPSTNYGGDNELVVEQDVTVHHSYLQFDVPGGTVPLGATLRLYVTNPSNDGGTVFSVANTYKAQAIPWEEMGITWDNAPDVAGTPLASSGTASSGTWVEWDVSAAVTQTGVISFGLTSSSTNSVRYSSREGSHPPELVLQTDPNASPSAVNDAFTTNYGDELVVGAPGVLGNDSDPDNEPLHALLVTAPAHGTLTLQDDGSFVYVPDAEFQGVDSFRYAACDAANGISLAWCNVHVRRVRPQRNDPTNMDVLANATIRWALPGTWMPGQTDAPLAVTIDSPDGRPVLLDVFDVRGRRVWHVEQRLSASTTSHLTWDGRSDAGARVGAGVYFARIHLAGESATRRVVLLR